MTTTRAAAGAIALVAIALGATGCSGDDPSDETTTSAAAEPWDPCTISDEALVQAGLDPASEGPGLSAEAPGWKTCRWESNDISVILGASTTTGVDQFRDNPENIDFQDVTVAGRQGFTYRDAQDDAGEFCWLTAPSQGVGILNMQVTRSPFTKDDTTPMCEWAVKVGGALIAGSPR
ncbi:DUF3558 domain-containing protein [Rhodococcus sp. HNM0569]|uniref:DUF3558 domain-containing protein n=1 Tax=Rhodococcus sp. HNM0569 TaxID=2716340 RepID=UPI00146BBF75|nr:DUF3558 domain-containing protein [Rhodococcus sp. HNM0569]NLU84989.1 DUF3558 family protein [Rhodococcus sp. HNM0569]